MVGLYDYLRQPRFVIGQLDSSVSPPSDTQVMLVIENECKKIFNLEQLFEFRVDSVMISLLCFESERAKNYNFVAEKPDFEY